MLKFLNCKTISNDIRMRRQVFNGSFILVEGRSDQRLYSKFVMSDCSQLVIGRTRDEVIEIVGMLASDNFLGVIAIIDADFDHLEGINYPTKPIFLTDTHDAETMMLKTEAFEALLCEFCSPNKKRNWEQKFGASICNQLLAESAKIGFALWHSKRDKLNLTFENLNADKFFDDDTLVISEENLIKHILAISGHPFAPTNDIEAGIHDLKKTNPDLWNVTCGHDFLELLACSLRRAIGTCKKSDVTEEILNRHLRGAYTFLNFSQTNIYKSIRTWANTHKPFEFFRNQDE